MSEFEQQQFIEEGGGSGDDLANALGLDGGGEEQDQELADVPEHLADAVEGTLRLKRMLSRDEETDGTAKRQKVGSQASQVKVAACMAKLQLAGNEDAKFVLECVTEEELTMLLTSNYVPSKFDQRKSPVEQVVSYLHSLRERSCPSSHAMDAVAAFKFTWKLAAEQEKALRALSHKDLRFVLDHFEEGADLSDVIATAQSTEPIEDSAFGAVPESPGVRTMGRFHRLELIDPLADCVVFGDANLTFSVKLAIHRKALGHVGRVVATTFEQVETLRERYPEIDETIKELNEMMAEVWHGVDCTRIAVDPKFEGMEGSFGAVYYNFPHAGAVSGFFDGHPLVNWRHENLMRLHFRALRSFVKPGGIVKVSSNAGAVGVRYSYIIGSAVENEFTHVETVPFLEWHLHRYGRSYGDKRDVYKRPESGGRYNAQRAESDMVYSFKYCPTDTPLPKQTIKKPPTLKTLLNSSEGPFAGLPKGQNPARQKLAEDLYARFMSECSGVHVG